MIFKGRINNFQKQGLATISNEAWQAPSFLFKVFYYYTKLLTFLQWKQWPILQAVRKNYKELHSSGAFAGSSSECLHLL